MKRPVTVVCLRSLSYTGTTWLNTVLGSTDRALALGPADRGLRIARGEEKGNACFVHGKDCDFWNGFVAAYDRDKNFFIQLADYSGKDVIVTNNLIPTGAAKQLEHPDIITRYIQVVRDGRALAASFKRKFPAVLFSEAITTFLQPSFHYFDFDKGNPDLLCLKYEDVLDNQQATLAQMADFLRLNYTERALKFWEFRHHLVGGNFGTVSLLKQAEGLPVAAFEGAAFYKEQYRRLSGGEPYSFKDERADALMTRYDRFVFDCLAGADNERYGYERDRFTTDEVREFAALLQLAHQEGKITGDFARQVSFFFGGQPGAQ